MLYKIPVRHIHDTGKLPPTIRTVYIVSTSPNVSTISTVYIFSTPSTQPPHPSHGGRFSNPIAAGQDKPRRCINEIFERPLNVPDGVPRGACCRADGSSTRRTPGTG